MAGETRKKNDTIVEDKAKPPKAPKHRPPDSVGQALKEAVSKAHEKEREDESPLARKLGEVSRYARSQYSEEKADIGRRYARRRKLLGDRPADEALDALDELRAFEFEQLEKIYSEFAASPAKLEVYLTDDCIPALEAQLKAGKRKTKKVQEEIALAQVDARQLRAFREKTELAQKLSYGLRYQYLPCALEHEAREPVVSARKARTLPNREKAIAKLEEITGKFKEMAASPSKAKEYLLVERVEIPKRKKAGLEPDGVEKNSMIASDLETAKSYISEAAPVGECYRAGVKCRLEADGFEAISDSTGSRIVRLIDSDGTQVAYRDGNEVRIVDSLGRGAIYRNGKLIERNDREGCIIQYCADANAKYRVMDRDGYLMILNPADELKFKILAPDGGTVLWGEKHAERLEGFRRIIRSLEGIEFGVVLMRADAGLAKAEKKLAEFARLHPQNQPKEADEAACIRQLSSRLRDNGIVRFDGEPTGNGCRARLEIYGKSLDANVVSKATFDMLKTEVKRNHPANAFPNPENTLVMELEKMAYASETAEEHPAQYVRQFTVKLDDGKYATVLALHKDMIDAIRNNDFTSLGERVYQDVYNELKAAKFSAVRIRLAWMPNSDVCRYIDERYGVKFREAMMAKDYNSLGAQQAFDNLVGNVTQTFTRPNVRAYSEKAHEGLRITAEDWKRADQYIAILLTEARARGGEEYPEVRDAVMKMHADAYGIDPPTNLRVLTNLIEGPGGVREAFLTNPSKEDYLTYQKLDRFRDLADPRRHQYRFVNQFEGFARRADLSAYVRMDPVARARHFEACRISFNRMMENELLMEQGRVVDKGLSIAMKRSRYGSRTAPTAFTISIHLQDIARRFERENQAFGQEVLFNELRGEVTPWDLVRRANQLLDSSHRYEEWSLISTRAKSQRISDIKEIVEEFFENVERGAGLGKAFSGG